MTARSVRCEAQAGLVTSTRRLELFCWRFPHLESDFGGWTLYNELI